MKHEQSENGPLSGATKGQALLASDHVQRPENPELERDSPLVAHRSQLRLGPPSTLLGPGDLSESSPRHAHRGSVAQGTVLNRWDFRKETAGWTAAGPNCGTACFGTQSWKCSAAPSIPLASEG